MKTFVHLHSGGAPECALWLVESAQRWKESES